MSKGSPWINQQLKKLPKYFLETKHPFRAYLKPRHRNTT